MCLNWWHMGWQHRCHGISQRPPNLTLPFPCPTFVWLCHTHISALQWCVVLQQLNCCVNACYQYPSSTRRYAEPISNTCTVMGQLTCCTDALLKLSDFLFVRMFRLAHQHYFSCDHWTADMLILCRRPGGCAASPASDVCWHGGD